MENKILNPISIKLDKGSGVVLEDTDSTEELSLIPGVMFGNEHYGFILITNNNGKQREIVYQTQCRIDAVGIVGGVLKIFEEGKKGHWKFDLKGNLKKSLYNVPLEENPDLYDIASDNYSMLMGEPIVKNPISLKIPNDPRYSLILSDDSCKEDYPLYPGTMIGGEHYGFILVIDDVIIDNKRVQKEIIYPTQNRIEAIGSEKHEFDDIKVFEQGKYNPWRFSYKGIFKEEASYSPYSRMDKEFIHKVFNTNIEDAKGKYNIKVRK